MNSCAEELRDGRAARGAAGSLDANEQRGARGVQDRDRGRRAPLCGARWGRTGGWCGLEWGPVVAVELNRNELKWDSHTQTALTLLRESTDGITRYKRQNESALLKSDG